MGGNTMRDIKRIDRIMNIITNYWKERQDQRFYQMMINLGLINDDVYLWNIEDDKLEKALEEGLNEKNTRRTSKRRRSTNKV
jgi:hypothetical protein